MMPCARVTAGMLYSSEGGNSPGSGSSDRCWPLLLHLSIDTVTIWGYTPHTALRYSSTASVTTLIRLGSPCRAGMSYSHIRAAKFSLYRLFLRGFSLTCFHSLNTILDHALSTMQPASMGWLLMMRPQSI